jgi:hypothetical protein
MNRATRIFAFYAIKPGRAEIQKNQIEPGNALAQVIRWSQLTFDHLQWNGEDEMVCLYEREIEVPAN